MDRTPLRSTAATARHAATTARVTATAGGPVPAAGAPGRTGDGRPPLAPRGANCCDIAMSLTMALLLITLL